MATKLTDHQCSILQAATECDSLSSARLRLQDLNRLAQKGFLEPFDSEADVRTGRIIVHFCITDAGRAVLNPPEPDWDALWDRKVTDDERRFWDGYLAEHDEGVL